MSKLHALNESTVTAVLRWKRYHSKPYQAGLGFSWLPYKTGRISSV